MHALRCVTVHATLVTLRSSSAAVVVKALSKKHNNHINNNKNRNNAAYSGSGQYIRFRVAHAVALKSLKLKERQTDECYNNSNGELRHGAQWSRSRQVSSKINHKQIDLNYLCEFLTLGEKREKYFLLLTLHCFICLKIWYNFTKVGFFQLYCIEFSVFIANLLENMRNILSSSDFVWFLTHFIWFNYKSAEHVVSVCHYWPSRAASYVSLHIALNTKHKSVNYTHRNRYRRTHTATRLRKLINVNFILLGIIVYGEVWFVVLLFLSCSDILY